MMYLWWSLYAVVWVILAFCLLWVAKKLFDWLTPYSVDVQLTQKDNPAVGLVLGGFLLGVIALIVGVFAGGGSEGEWLPSLAALGHEVLSVLMYTLPGMALLFFAGIVNDRVVLHGFSIHREIVDARNLAVGAIVSAAYIGSGLIVGGGIAGSFSLLSALVAFAVGQTGLVLFAALYQRMTSYDDQEEIGKRQNVAAGVAFAGNLLAYSLILMKGVSMSGGDVESLPDRVAHFAYYALAGGILLVIIRTITDRVFLPSAKLSKEVAIDRNLSAGFVEAALAIAAGLILILCL